MDLSASSRIPPPAKPPAAWLPAVVLGLASGLAVSGARAQAPTLESVKKAHAAEVAKTVKPLREVYCRALLALEQSLAGKRDYAGAAEVRKERLEMEETAGLRSVGHAAPKLARSDGAVSLEAREAELLNGVKLEESGKSLTGWETKGATARWMLPAGLPEGGYDVVATFTVAAPQPENGAGTFRFQEEFHTLSRPLKPARADGDTGANAVVLGTLRLRANASVLEMKCVTAVPGAQLRLLGLRLVPCSADS